MSAAAPPSGRVLVLGGTGHIGAAVARCFAGAGFAVAAAGRRAGVPLNLQGTAVTRLIGDDTDPAHIDAWVRNTDIVVDAATPYPLWRHEGGARAVVHGARRRMAQILAACARERCALVHVSSFTTLPVAGTVQERMRIATLRGMHPYFEVKEAVERDVLNALRGGLKGCVVNPSACFGPYDMKPAELAFIPMLMQGRVAGVLRHPVNVIDVRDVAAAILACVRAGFAAPQVPLAGHDVRIDLLTRRICALAGVAPPALAAPLMPTVLASWWAESAAAIVGRRSPWPSLPMLLTAAGRAMAPSAEQLALNVAIRPLEDTLRDAVAWYRVR